MAHNSLSMYFYKTIVYSLLHCQTIVQILHHFAVTVNNIEVTVNICTCKDVFTIITTKDQSDGIYMDTWFIRTLENYKYNSYYSLP